MSQSLKGASLHEAGHALAVWSYHLQVEELHADADGSGYCHHETPVSNDPERTIVIALAGSIAEEMFGEEGYLSSDDLQAARLAEQTIPLNVTPRMRRFFVDKTTRLLQLFSWQVDFLAYHLRKRGTLNLADLAQLCKAENSPLWRWAWHYPRLLSAPSPRQKPPRQQVRSLGIRRVTVASAF